jgi:hypothetical protein
MEIVMYYHVLLEDHTTGYINSDTIDGQHAEDFIGERVTVHLHDENGMPIEKTGILIEVLDEALYLEYQF